MQTDTGETIYPFNAVCVYGVPEGVVVELKVCRMMMMHRTNGSPDVMYGIRKVTGPLLRGLQQQQQQASDEKVEFPSLA
jgi:hypothetical protein